MALIFAFFINAAILILAAATFHQTGHQEVAEIGDAYQLLTPLLGTTLASTLFAVALLASGQNSTITGTLAGQIVMEGFLDIRLPAWLRRLITRLIAIVPAVIVTAHLRRARQRRAADPEPGHPEPAALVRRGAAGPLHQPAAERWASSRTRRSSPAPRGRWRSSSCGLNAWLLFGTFREWLA